MVATFIVDTEPFSKQRPRKNKYGIMYTPAKTKQAEEYIRLCFKNRCPLWKKTDKNIVISIDFIFKMKSKSKTFMDKNRGQYCDLHKDIDNLTKTVLDALNNVAYIDDKQVVGLIVKKLWGDESLSKITLEEI